MINHYYFTLNIIQTFVIILLGFGIIMSRRSEKMTYIEWLTKIPGPEFVSLMLTLKGEKQ